ncbi:Longin-like domain-containing protein [Choanephora cucurbitarum]|nr:Longin-like domain-containing protein [Choanephora cucurbitarum]
MQRSRIEGILASFPKLTSTGQQHTTVETEHVRFVYQPLDDLFMVLITNRQSNILQDIESLHLFARVVTDICRSCDEHYILRNAFELLCAFDEIISVGYRENVNLSQVKSSIEMESHEERIQEIIAKNKEQEAKEELKRRAKQFEMQRKEAQKRGQGFMQGNFNSSNINMGGYGGGSGYSPSTESLPSMRDSSPSFNRSSSTTSAPVSTSKARGMQLGRKPKAADLFEAIKPDVEEPALSSPSAGHRNRGALDM